MLSGNQKTALEDFLDPVKLDRFRTIMQETRECMNKRSKTGFPNDTDKCEGVELSRLNLWSFHTHPHGKTTPSELDIQTNIKMKKSLMCIGLAPTGEIVCYDTIGKKVIQRIRV